MVNFTGGILLINILLLLLLQKERFSFGFLRTF